MENILYYLMAKSALCKNEKIKNKSDDPNQIPFFLIGQWTSIFELYYSIMFNVSILELYDEIYMYLNMFMPNLLHIYNVDIRKMHRIGQQATFRNMKE